MDNKKDYKTNTAVPLNPNDDQYFDLRGCLDSADSFEVKDRLGINKNPYDCMSKWLWFLRGVDFGATGWEASGIDVNRDDQDSDMALQQTVGKNLTWEKSFPIVGKYGTPFMQYWTEFFANEKSNEGEGNGLIALSNGGIHYERTITFNKGSENEYVIKLLYPRLKTSHFIEPLAGDLAADTTWDFDCLVETMPFIFITGKIPEGFAVPRDLNAPVIGHGDITLNAGTLTIPSLTMTDEDLVAESEIVIINAVDQDGNTVIDNDYFDTSDGTLTDYTATVGADVTSLTIQLAYPMSKFVSITTEITTVDKVAEL